MDWLHTAKTLQQVRSCLATLSSITGGKELTQTATLSAKFRISIPKAVRSRQQWEAGVVFAFIRKGTGVLLVPIPGKEQLQGIAAGADPSDYRDRADRT